MKNAAAFVDFHRKLSTISIFYPQYVENTGFIGIYEEEQLWISCGEFNIWAFNCLKMQFFCSLGNCAYGMPLLPGVKSHFLRLFLLI